MHRGYIKLWRKTMDSFIFKNSEVVHLWVTLLMLAGYEEREFIFNGRKMNLKRGQFISGRKKLAELTGIHESSIFRYLKLLENEHLIEQQKTNLYSIISIVCYDKYQSNEQVFEQPVNNQRTTTEQPVNTTNTLISIKASNKEEKASVYAHNKEAFSAIWNLYPKKLGKKHAERHFNASVKSEEDRSNIKKALSNYMSSIAGKDHKYIKHGGTWFNEWQDWVDYKEVSNEPGRRMLE